MAKVATFTVSLNTPGALTATINYATVALTAAGGTDFTMSSGTLTFNPGQTSKTVLVPILANTAASVDKKFRCLLSNPVNCTLPATPSNECVISTAAGGGGGGTDPGGGGTDPNPTTGPGALPGVSVDGPMIKNGLITNAYNNEYGRGGYFHPASGTTEGQAIMISAGFLVNDQLKTGSAEEIATGLYLKNLSLEMLDAIGDGSVDGPMLRQPIPADPNVITMLHWLFAARADIPSQGVVLDLAATPVAGKLRIPTASHASEVYRIWMIYPTTSELLYGSPYSPAFDKVMAVGETQIKVLDTDWAYDSATSTVVLTLPASAPSGVPSWSICYGYQGAGTIPQGSAQEAYPAWTLLADGYVSCAPDTFRWFEECLTLAIVNDTRPGKATAWTNLRAASRRTAVRGQTLSDKREVLRPLPGFAVIPPTGEPSGMFCYSDHPSAQPPSNPLLNQQWIGYSFWSRATNGDILGTIPNSAIASQVQLGRGFNDEWRALTVYQDPDQYLYVSLSCTKKPGVGEHFYIYASSTKYYAGTTRYYADIGLYAGFVATSQAAMDAGTVIDFLIPITDFKRKDSDSAVLTAGTKFQNFGISAEMTGAYNIRLRDMRLISGVSKAFVDANFGLAKKGSQLPFFPGAMPFNIGADTILQQFIGYSGNPFHGYQLPDFWYYLGADALAVHGSLGVGDLPVVTPGTGAIVHTMALTTSGGTTKPLNSLLMEQQVRFLFAAQVKYQGDGGQLGPFAHTFVINTPDRINIGNPQPNLWVYTNDDPNTRWIGYQCRVVESLAKLCFLAKADAGFDDSVAIAKVLVSNFLVWLNNVWPNLNGVSHTDTTTGVTKLLKGMPTEFDDPATMPIPVTAYDEPHGPAIIMRACIHYKLCFTDQNAICDALISRCWAYMETVWVSAAGEMQYTWSPDPAAYQWYGFWTGEIYTMTALALENPTMMPAGFPLALLRTRMVQHQSWLALTGVK